MPRLSLFMLESEAAGLVATVEVNGVKLTQGPQRETVRQASKINGWLLPGSNRLLVQLAQLPPAKARGRASAQKPEMPPRFALRLREGVPGTPDQQDRQVLDYRWDQATQPLSKLPVTVFEQDFPAHPAAEWSWVKAAPVLKLTAEDREEISTLLHKVQSALVRKDIAEVVSYQKIQISEQAQAMGLEPERMLRGYETFLQERMASRDWKVLPLDRLHFLALPEAHGRIQRITDADGAPPISTTFGDGSFALDPYLSKINGAWTIVR